MTYALLVTSSVVYVDEYVLLGRCTGVALGSSCKQVQFEVPSQLVVLGKTGSSEDKTCVTAVLVATHAS